MREQKEHPEQAEGAQGEREVTPNPSCSMCSGNGYFCEFSTVETCWCCLPEPEPEETVEALKERIESLKACVTHMKQQRDAGVARAALAQPSPAFAKPSLLKDCDVRYAANAQPSPAPELELEAPTSVGVLILGGAVSSTELGDNDVTLDGQVVERIQRELVSDSEDVAVELMIVGQHYRILQALRADRDNARRTAEYWKAEHLAANAALDAAQARVAELEKQESALWFWLERGDETNDFARRARYTAKRPTNMQADLGMTPYYTAPVAQAGQVPEVSGIARAYDHPRAIVLYLRKEPTDDDMRAIQEGLRMLTKQSSNPAPEPVTCPRCQGDGTIWTGIDESPSTICNRCDGTGSLAAAPAQGGE